MIDGDLEKNSGKVPSAAAQGSDGPPTVPNPGEGRTATSANPLDGVDSPSAKLIDEASARKLSPEEQMALYEKDLKENDWGHQPC